jgi:hypothetical protein
MDIPLIDKDAAPALVRRLYEGLEHAGRSVGNFHKVLANTPNVLRACLQRWSDHQAEFDPAHRYATQADLER